MVLQCTSHSELWFCETSLEVVVFVNQIKKVGKLLT
jgi:hypothetical protein